MNYDLDDLISKATNQTAVKVENTKTNYDIDELINKQSGTTASTVMPTLPKGYEAIKAAEVNNTNNSNDWGNVLKQSANVGLTNFNKGMASALKFATRNTPFIGDNIGSFFDKQINSANNVIDKYSDLEKTKAQQVVGDVVSSGVQVAADVPLMLMSAPLKGAELAATKLPVVVNAVKQFITKPVALERTTVYFGQSYEEAKQDGASDMQATVTALKNAIPSAIIEGAGGLDTVAKRVIEKQAKSGGKALLKDILKSALEEGGEEIFQYPLGAMSKATYKKDTPVYSNTEEAIINPKQMAYSGALGGLAGGVLGGGMKIASNAIQTSKARPDIPKITSAPTNQKVKLPVVDFYGTQTGQVMNQPISGYLGAPKNTLPEITKISERADGSKTFDDKVYSENKQANLIADIQRRAKRDNVPFNKQLQDDITTAQNIVDKAINDNYEYIINYKGRGADWHINSTRNNNGNYTGGQYISNNDKWYEDFLRENGRKPSRVEARELAKEWLFDTNYTEKSIMEAASNLSILKDIQKGGNIIKVFGGEDKPISVIYGEEGKSIPKIKDDVRQPYYINAIKKSLPQPITAPTDAQTDVREQIPSEAKTVQPTQASLVIIEGEQAIAKAAETNPEIRQSVDNLNAVWQKKGLTPKYIYDEANANINGLINGSEITINLASKEALADTAVHELVHNWSNTDPETYKKFSSLLDTVIVSDEKYQKLYKDTLNTYKAQFPDMTEEQINREAEAVITKDFLIDEKKLQSLVLKDRNIVQKLLDYVKQAINSFGINLMDSNAARLREAQRLLEKALGENVDTVKQSDTAYSINENETKTSKLATSVMEGDMYAQNEEFAKRIDNDFKKAVYDYQVVKDQNAINKAKALMEDWETANNRWKAVASGNAIPSKLDIVLGEQLMTEAVNRGDFKRASEIVAELVLVAPNLGQSVQAFSLINKLAPEGKLYYVERAVAKLNTELSQKNNNFKPIAIPQEIKDELLAAKTEKEMRIAESKIKKIIAEQTPATLNDKITAWRYTSMLGNVKTQVKNVMGNAMMYAVRKNKDNFAALLEAATIRGDKERTKAFGLMPKELRNFANEDFENVRQEITSGKKFGFEEDISANKKIFGTSDKAVIKQIGNFVEGWRKLTMNSLEVADAKFLRLNYSSALAQYMKSNKLTPETITTKQLNRARQIAILEAQKATFRDANKLARALNRIEKSGVIGNVFVGGILPFKKTPANILKRGVEYSPAGFIKNAADFVKYKQGKISFNDFLDGIASSFTGTSLMGIGVALGMLGVMSVKGDDNDRVNRYEDMQGNQDYSINLGDNSITLDWIVPSGLAIFMGAGLIEGLSEEYDAETATNIAINLLAKTTDPMLETSMLQGLENALSSYDKDNIGGSLGNILSTALTGYIGQFVPTILGQASRSIDTTRRDTYGPTDSPITKEGEYAARKLANKTPLSKLSEPYVDLWGREQKSKNPLADAAINFLSPSYVEQKNITPLDKEINRLYDKTGEASVIPNKPYGYIKYDDKRYDLSAPEYTDYKKEIGQLSYDILSDVTKDANYKKLPDVEKVNVIEKAYDYSKTVAKDDYLESKGVDYEPDKWITTMQKAKEIGIDEGEWLMTNYYLSNAEGEKDNKGDTISGSQKQARWDIINEMNISANKKEQIWELVKEQYGYK